MRFSVALALSALVHALLAGGLVLCVPFGEFLKTEVPPFDLSSVELSFSEEEDESAPPSAAMPEAPLPDGVKPGESHPPEPDLSLPAPPPPEAETLEVPRPAEVRETLPEIRVAGRSNPAVASVPAPQQARIDAPPRPFVTIRPAYPREARQRGEQGRVLVEVRIDELGRVDAVAVVESSGFAALDAAAVKAVRTAKFRPARAGGRPVADTRRMPVEFKLK